MCWNDAYLILGLKDQYMGNYHNNVTHISSVAVHVGIVDIHTLLTWTRHMLLYIYNSHVTLQSFICPK